MRRTAIDMDPFIPFYSENTLNRSLDILLKDVTAEGEEYWVVIRKDRACAVIGRPGIREPSKTPGMEIIFTLPFKETSKGFTLEVDPTFFRIREKVRKWDLLLRTALVNAGFIIC